MMSPPTAVVEALPYFVGGDPADARNVVKECKDLLEGDGSMLVHVVGLVLRFSFFFMYIYFYFYLFLFSCVY